MQEIKKAYALLDNPFILAESLPKEVPNPLRDFLATAPLAMAQAKAELLVKFYCDAVYPPKMPLPKGSPTAHSLPMQNAPENTPPPQDATRTPFEDFKRKMALRGYKENPKTLDQIGRSLIVLIRGLKGTGKTTLAHRMMRWLMSCDPDGKSWKQVTWEPDSEEQNAHEQSISLSQGFKPNVERMGTGSFLCLIDDIKKEADSHIFKLFRDLLPGRVLFFFLTSTDPEIRGKRYSNVNPPVTVYDTDILTPGRAVSYCKHRIDAVRWKEAFTWLSTHPLFPFTHEIIEASVSSESSELWDNAGSVSLREFNVRFGDSLEFGRESLGADFDIANVPADQIEQYLLNPCKIGA
jgi:hypothetical protein